MSDELRWKQSSEPKVVYALEPFPDPVTKSMFLAGPTPRSAVVPSWRKDAIEYLKGIGYDGHVFVPEPRDGSWAEDYINQVEWEEDGLNRADVIVFYVPRDMNGETYGTPMPALTTNDEWGDWKSSGKVVFGAPDWAEHVRYQQHYAKELGVPLANTLEGTLQNAVSRAGPGALRKDGQCQVPLCIWNKAEFQGWLHAQEEAGNRLDGCRVLWTFWVGENRDNLFSWALHVDMHVGAENRQKANEFVLFRRDVAAVVLYSDYNPVSGDARVVFVREFRSPGRTESGYVTEVPGGGIEDGAQAEATALKEVEEETGIQIDPSRLIEVGARQLAATLSAHTGAVYTVNLSSGEMDAIEERHGQVGGVDDCEERTYLEVHRLHDVLQRRDVDWATLGMVMVAIDA